MTRWVAIFDDDPDGAWVRREHSADRFAYLESHKDRIVLGGGLRPAPEEWWVGGLWVMEVASRDEAVRLCEEDPYFKHGLRKGYRLYTWGKAPCYGKVEL
jgi:hypothetical protein